MSTSLIECVYKGDIHSVLNTLSQNADLNEKDNDGRTPLIHAATDNKIEIAKLLINSGASLNAQDKLGNSALHYAAQDYHPEMVRLLVCNNAVVDAEDIHGNTPLWRATFNSGGRGEVIHILLKASADRDHRNKHGKSPLDLAKTIANYDIIQFFN